MSVLSSHSAVDQMVAELAELRQAAASRRAAYIALAQAIVSEDQHQACVPSAFVRRPAGVRHAERVA